MGEQRRTFIQQSFRIISEINQPGTSILLVEQNAQQALSRAHRAYVLETGSIVKSGTGAEMLADPSIKESYLGVAWTKVRGRHRVWVVLDIDAGSAGPCRSGGPARR